MWRKSNSHALIVGLYICAATIENSMETLPKIKNRTTIQSTYSTSGDLSEEYKNTNLKRGMHPYVH